VGIVQMMARVGAKHICLIKGYSPRKAKAKLD
jgi:hypothetical protein